MKNKREPKNHVAAPDEHEDTRDGRVAVRSPKRCVASASDNGARAKQKDETARHDKLFFHTRLDGIERAAFEQVHAHSTTDDERVGEVVRQLYAEPWTLFARLFDGKTDLFSVRTDLTQEENVVFRRYHVRVLQCFLNELEEMGYAFEQGVAAMTRQRLAALEPRCVRFEPAELLRHFASPEKLCYMQQWVDEFLDRQLGWRGKKVVKECGIDVQVLADLFGQPISAYRQLCPGRYLRKTLPEIQRANRLFEQVFFALYQKSEAEMATEEVKSKFPFLTRGEADFVVRYGQAHDGHLPGFFIICRKLSSSQRRDHRIYILRHGMLGGRRHTMGEIAAVEGISVERVRQVLAASLRTDCPEADEACRDTVRRLAEDKPFVYETTEGVAALVADEHLKCSFGELAGLMAQTGMYCLHEVADNCAVLVRCDCEKRFDLQLQTGRLADALGARRDKDTTMSVNGLLSGVPQKLRAAACDLLCYVGHKVYGLESDAKGRFVLRQNNVNVEKEIYEILKKSGKPMHIDHIFRAFKAKYPNHRFGEAKQLKYYLFKNPQVGAIGKRSTFGLRSWKGLFFGNMREMLLHMLGTASAPLSVERLLRKVRRTFPDATAPVLRAAMRHDALQRFAAYGSDRFGLAERSYPPRYVRE